MAYVMSPALHFSAPRSSIALVKDPVGLRPGNQLRGVQPAASHGGRDVPPGERSADSPPTRPSVRCVAFALVIPGGAYCSCQDSDNSDNLFTAAAAPRRIGSA